MKQNLLNDLVAAMKNQDKETLSVLRMVKGAIQLEEINKKSELTDDDFIGVISKQIKTRKESVVEFEKAGRNDLVEQNNAEINLLNKYMPEQLDEEEINNIINDVFEKIKPTSQKDMGLIMKEISPKLKGKADMGYVNGIIKNKLNDL